MPAVSKPFAAGTASGRRRACAWLAAACAGGLPAVAAAAGTSPEPLPAPLPGTPAPLLPTWPGRELHHRLTASNPPRVALTLDACSGAADTALLGFLVRERIPASVFVTARWLAANRQAVALLRVHPDLFAFENHGEHHVPAVIGAGLSVYGLPGAADLDALRREVLEGARAVQAAAGIAPRWYRAATARYDAAALQELARLGVRVAGFSLNADGGGTLAATQVAARVARAQDGDVILAHLNRPGAGTRAGLEQALPVLRQRGFTFVRLDTHELVEVKGLQP